MQKIHFLVITSSLLFSGAYGAMPSERQCQFERLVGSCPGTACIVRARLKQRQHNGSQQAGKYFEGNTLLLLGPYGDGKTSLAENIAEEAGCVYRRVQGKYFRDDAGFEAHSRTIEQHIEAAIAQAKVRGVPAVVFFDEMEEMHPDAREAVRSNIDTYKGHPDLFMAAAAKDIKGYGEKFAGRFRHHIRVEHPDDEERTGLLYHYLEGDVGCLNPKAA